MKSKKALLIAGLAVVSGLSFGAFAACVDTPDEPEHTHSYTQWAHDEDQHWKVCPEDGAIDESSREDHIFVAGECECGAEETVVEHTYGSASGQVKLRKLGKFVDDYSGVSIDMGSDDVTVDYDAATGEFTIEDIIADTPYTLTVSKPGYQDYTINVQVGEDENVVLGGSRGIVLEYEIFESLLGWDWEKIDFSNANAENATLGYSGPGGTFSVLTKDSFEEVAATVGLNWYFSTNGQHTQGIILLFENGQHAVVRYHNGDGNGNIQYYNGHNNGSWEMIPESKSVFTGMNEWGELPIYNLTAEERAEITTGEGTDLTVAVKGGELVTYFGGTEIGTYTLPEGVGKVRVAYFSWDTASNVTIPFAIAEDPSASIVPAISVNKPSEEGAAAANVTADKDSYVLGDDITLNVTVPDGYMLNSLLVNGREMKSSVTDGVLTTKVARGGMIVEAEFMEEVPVALDLIVTGDRSGTREPLPQGTVVTFKDTDYSFVVGENGRITAPSVIKNLYTVVVDGYYEQQIQFDETLTSIELEYQMFVDGSDGHYPLSDFDLTNAVNGEFTHLSGWGIGLLSNEHFTGDLAFSLTSKMGNHTNKEFVVILFEDGSFFAASSCGKAEGDFRIENFPSGQGLGWGNNNPLKNNINPSGSWDYRNAFGEALYGANNPSAELAALRAKWAGEGFDLRLVKQGAVIYVLANDVFIDCFTLDEKYADMDYQFGYIVWDPANNWTYSFDYTTDVSQYLKDATPVIAAAQNGTVALEKDSYTIGQTAVISIEPAQGYRLEKLMIDGRDMTASVADGKLEIRVDSVYEIEASFAEVAFTDVTVNITGHRYGVDGNSLEGQKVTLSDSANTYAASVTDGIAVFEDVPSGSNYTLSAEGYVPVTGLEITEDGLTEAELTLEFDLFENLTTAWGWGDNADLSNQNDGSIMHAIGSTEWVSSKIPFGDVAITVATVVDGQRQGVFIRFKGDSYAQDGYMMIQKEWNSHISWNGETNIWGFGSNLCGDWNGYINPLEEGRSYELTLVRDANRIHVFIDGVYYDTKTLDASYADRECYVGIFCTDASQIVGKEQKFRIEDASAYLKQVTVTDETTDANGSLEISEGIVLGDTVTVTIKPAEGYKLASLTVDGAEVALENVKDGVYTFTASKVTHTVAAAFEKLATADVTVNITGHKYDVAGNSLEGQKVTLSDSTNTYTASVTDGVAVFEGVPTGAGYTLSAKGYVAVTGLEVTEDGLADADFTLEFERFVSWVGYDNDIHDYSHVNDTPATIGVNAGDQLYKSFDIISTESFGDVSATIYAKNDNAGVIQGIVLRFEDGKAAIFNLKTDQTIVQFRPDLWGVQSVWPGAWKESAPGSVTEEDIAKFNSAEGISVTLTRRGSMLYAFVDGRFVYSVALPAGYEDDQIQVGYFAGDVKGSAVWKIEISETLTLPASVTVTDETTDTNGSLEISEGIVLGDTVIVTIRPAAGYKLASLTVDGAEAALENVKDGVYTFTASKEEHTVAAAFEQVATVDLSLGVTGHKYGVAGNAIADGAKVVLKDGLSPEIVCTVSGGKITANSLPVGSYTASTEGYGDIAFTVDENGASVQELAFEYRLFESLVGWDQDKHDFTNVNNEDASIGYTGPGGTFNVITTDSYKDVTVTLGIDWNFSKHNMHTQGIILVFENNKHLIVRYHNGDTNGNIQYCNSAWDPHNAGNSLFDASANLNQWGENPVHNLTDEERAAITSGGGLNLTVSIRDGKLYTSFNGVEVGEYTIPAEYADQEVRVGFFSWDTADNVTMHFEISEEAN